jgi:nemo like kinase
VQHPAAAAAFWPAGGAHSHVFAAFPAVVSAQQVGSLVPHWHHHHHQHLPNVSGSCVSVSSHALAHHHLHHGHTPIGTAGDGGLGSLGQALASSAAAFLAPQPPPPMVAPLTQHHHPHHVLMSPRSFAAGRTVLSLPSQQPVTTVNPEQPIGYGSFGVVWSVVNSRTGQRAALKKIPSIHQSLLGCIRTFREVKILCELDNENLLSATDLIQPPVLEHFTDVYIMSPLMESDLHQIIVSAQQLTEDHVKVFVYQVLRGLKYLHSAGVIHRDLKPGNLLVNSNCLLKICDFGFSRAIEPDRNTPMTLEVVTQYYRAPELLAGCKHYDTAIDMWSVGCIFAELLGRRILFEASNPTTQLEMITDILGAPSREDVAHVTSHRAVKSLLSQAKPRALSKLYALSPTVSHGAVHLLSQMLVFNPSKRISCVDALDHPYLEDGRMRYHTFLCSCCRGSGAASRQYCTDLEPLASKRFDPSYERELTTLCKAKAELHYYIRTVHPHRPHVFINPNSEQFQHFQSCLPGVPAASSARA